MLQCTRKTEVRSWKTLFDYLPPARELFEESLQRGSLKTAGGYLIVLHTLEEMESVPEQSVRLLTRALREEDWELCKELARFLAALDETGATLREAMALADLPTTGRGAAVPQGFMARLAVPPPGGVHGLARTRDGGDNDETESDMQSLSDGGSYGSGSPSEA